MGVVSKEVRVGLDKTGREDACWVDRYSANHRGLEKADWRHIRKRAVIRTIAIERVMNLHARLRRDGHGQCIGVITRSLAQDWFGNIPIKHESRSSRIGRIWGWVCTDFPTRSTVCVSGPTVVFLVGLHIRSVSVALHNVAKCIGQHHRLLLALVNPEIGVQESTGIQHAILSASATNDGQESIWRDSGARWNLEFCGIGRIVRHVPTSDVNRPCSGVEQLNKIFIVSGYVQ